MAPPAHCPEHERLIEDIATIKANTKHILYRVTEINDRLDVINGRVRDNEVSIAALKAWAIGAGAGAGAVMGVAMAIISHLIK